MQKDIKVRLISLMVAATIAAGFAEIPQGTVGASGGVKLDSKHFPDANFRKLVAEEFDINMDGTLSTKEISKAEILRYDGEMTTSTSRYFGHPNRRS